MMKEEDISASVAFVINQSFNLPTAGTIKTLSKQSAQRQDSKACKALTAAFVCLIGQTRLRCSSLADILDIRKRTLCLLQWRKHGSMYRYTEAATAL